MKKILFPIWDGIAELEIPQNFVEATAGERRKVYGLRSDIPMHMLIDREKRVLSVVQE